MNIYDRSLNLDGLLNFEKENLENKYFQAKIFKKDISTIKFFLDNDYEISQVDNQFYYFQKENTEKKSFRISLTENCNYKCFFCHEEGMEMGEKRTQEKEYEEIESMVLTAISKGYEDLTFTGGEPLLKKSLLIKLLSKLNTLERTPDTTIVTNGLLIDDVLLEEVSKYKGKIKFNLSMHHLDRDKYYDIVIPKNNKKDNFEKVIENIKSVVEKGIYIKLNFVVLNGINNSKEDLEQILDFASAMKVNRVKFLEFLVTDKLLHFYKYYFTLNSLKEILKDKMDFIKKDLRTEYFKYKSSDLEIELAHCTCAIGCSRCILAKDLTLTSELKYFPCFFRSNIGFDLNKDFDDGVLKGNKIIEAYSKKYLDKTPFKVSNKEFIETRTDYLYYLENPTEIEEFLKKIGESKFKHERKRQYIEKIYGENASVKVYKNSYDHNYIEVVKKIELNDNCLETQYLFGKSQRIIEDIDKYEKYLELLGVSKKKELKWELDYYVNQEKELSIGKLQGSRKLFVLCNYKENEFSLSKLYKSFEATAMEENN